MGHDQDHRSVATPRTVHWLVEFVVAVRRGHSVIVAKRLATEITGQEAPETEILERIGAYYRAVQDAGSS